MSREVRMVPADWEHPHDGYYADGSPRFRSLFDGAKLEAELADWDEGAAKWAGGFVRDYSTYPAKDWRPKEERSTGPYSDYAGERPNPDDYMPNWPAEQRTHLMMYETTSEGSPISPAFSKPEELARWLADTNASAFGGEGATYEQWLATILRGWAPSAVMEAGEIRSGVAALAEVQP